MRIRMETFILKVEAEEDAFCSNLSRRGHPSWREYTQTLHQTLLPSTNFKRISRVITIATSSKSLQTYMLAYDETLKQLIFLKNKKSK